MRERRREREIEREIKCTQFPIILLALYDVTMTYNFQSVKYHAGSFVK